MEAPLFHSRGITFDLERPLCHRERVRIAERYSAPVVTLKMRTLCSPNGNEAFRA